MTKERIGRRSRLRPATWVEVWRLRERARQSDDVARLRAACAQSEARASALGHRLGQWRSRRDRALSYAVCQHCVQSVVLDDEARRTRRPMPGRYPWERPWTRWQGQASGPPLEAPCTPCADPVDRAIDLCTVSGLLPWAADYGPLHFVGARLAALEDQIPKPG